MANIKDTYVDFAQTLFHMLTNKALSGKKIEDFRNDKIMHISLLLLNFIFVWGLLPMFIFLPLIAFFFSIGTAIFVATFYPILLLICIIIKMYKLANKD